MYKREAAEYDIAYVKKYDDDLNTTLIFVRRLSSTPIANNLTFLTGGSILCCQFRFRP